MRRCALDVDGVLADMVYGCVRHYDAPDPWQDPANLGRYDLAEMLGMTPQACYGGLPESFWAGLDPTPEFADILGMVERTFGRENVCIATAPVMSRGCYDGKLRWMERHLPYYFKSGQFMVGKPKWFMAHPDMWLVDDCQANCELFTEWGGNSILVPRPWNGNHHLSGACKNYVWTCLPEANRLY